MFTKQTNNKNLAEYESDFYTPNVFVFGHRNTPYSQQMIPHSHRLESSEFRKRMQK